ncbi:MAG TPA: aminopeptidase [Myxococcota bacterium]|nr:aminopeptidase [Myxococcota bacterium]
MHRKRARRALAALLLPLPLFTSGCYLAHLARGQMRLLCARVPVEEVLRADDTPPALRAQLERVAEVRAFAEQLGLSVGGRYTQYAPWPGDFVVTTVVATRPGEVEPVTSWFPIVGSVPYRGYFEAESADAYAEKLRRQDLDVCEQKVRAYSTLGWFDDPLTGPMLREEEDTLVETLFHELLHATVFVPGDPEFNEGVAAFYGQEARVRFYTEVDGAAAGERERKIVSEHRRLSAEILSLRRAVENLYGSDPPGPERAQRRAELEAEARARIAALELTRYNSSAIASDLQLGDACLAISGTYHADTAGLVAVLEFLHGDLRAFLTRVRAAAEADDPRAALLGEQPAEAAAAPR